MKRSTLAIVAATAFLGAIGTANAQSASSGTGDAAAQNRSSIVGISGANRARFRSYAVGAGYPSYAYGQPVVVGTVLPESGLTYYDVPAEYGVDGYRYTIVNDAPVLVEPSSRRVIQVIE